MRPASSRPRNASSYLAKRPIESVPQMPQVPCTEMAPTGSSILTLSKARTEKTTITPPTRPMTKAKTGVTVPTGAVMDTRPASAPLPAIATSATPVLSQMIAVAPTTPAAAAIKVFMARNGTNSSAASSEPALKPNQPNQRMNTPITAYPMLWPGIARGLPSSPYLPIRGPRR